jgi:hypothetical protein
MCGKLLVVLLLCFSLAALPSQEAPRNWYLISEPELQSIEQYREKSEAERQIWLSQVNELKDLAGKSQTESANLNRQLSTAREAQKKLEKLFDKYAEGHLTTISLKNGEIAGLRAELADKTIEAEKYKVQGTARFIVIIALIAVLVLCIALCITIRVLRALKIIPI